VVIPSKSQKRTCHELAEECRRLAQIVPEDMRASYLGMAELYEQLVKDTGCSPSRTARFFEKIVGSLRCQLGLSITGSRLER
jgi:hypothetical protein